MSCCATLSPCCTTCNLPLANRQPSPSVPKNPTRELIAHESPLLRINRERGYNWTYTEIARATGIDRSAIARLFERETLTPDFITVWKLARLFDVPIEEVVDDAWFRDEDVLSPHGLL